MANKKKCPKDKCRFVDMGSGGEWCLPLKTKTQKGGTKKNKRKNNKK